MSDPYLRQHVGDDEPQTCWEPTHWRRAEDTRLQAIADAWKKARSEVALPAAVFLSGGQELAALLDALVEGEQP